METKLVARRVRPSILCVASLQFFLSFTAGSKAGETLSKEPGDTLAGVPTNGEKMIDYYVLGVSRRGLVVNAQTGQEMSEWRTSSADGNHTDITWIDPNNPPEKTGKPLSIEEWSIKDNCSGGEAFLWVSAYRNDYPERSRSKRFRIETTRAELSGRGEWIDITTGGSCGTNGQPYALLKVTTAPYSLRVWGNLYKADGVTIGRRFFWQQTVTYIPSAYNSCWASDAMSSRPAIKREEAWWDSSHGWTLGSSGSMGANGEPDGEHVNYGRWTMIGKGAGYGWALGRMGSGARGCLSQHFAK